MSLDLLLKPRLCELGSVRIGKKEEKVRRGASGDWRAPMKLDHFIICTLQRDNAGDFVQDDTLTESLALTHGDRRDNKLRQIPITLLSNDITDSLQAALLWYNGKKLGARSDGKTVTFYYNPKKPSEKLEPPREMPWDDKFLTMGNGKQWKKHTTLSFVITSQDSRWGGVYKFRTTSNITADQLYGSLLQVSALTLGVLRGLPLMLVVRPMQVSPEGKPTTVYVVHVELRGTDIQAIQSQAVQFRQMELSNSQAVQATESAFRKLLRAPGVDETEAEISDIVDEFHPPESGDAKEDDKPKDDAPDPLLADLGITAVVPDGVNAVTGEVTDESSDCQCPDGPAGVHTQGCPVIEGA